METLKEVREYLNDVEDINWGGCAIAMLAMYRWLKKNNQLKPDTCFIFLHDNTDRYERNKESLSNIGQTPTACTHACLYHDGKYIDSKSNIDIRNYRFMLKIDSEEFIVESINNRSAWNDTFERDKYVPDIAEDLEIDLSDLNYVKDVLSVGYMYNRNFDPYPFY